jgi:hypothetical protein
MRDRKDIAETEITMKRVHVAAAAIAVVVGAAIGWSLPLPDRPSPAAVTHVKAPSSCACVTAEPGVVASTDPRPHRPNA